MLDNHPLSQLDFTIPSDAVSIVDYVRYAQKRMSPQAWAYITGAAGEGLTQEANRMTFAHYPLRNRVLRDLSGGHCRFSIFGHEYQSPIFLAPAAGHKLCHPDGELATVMGASALGCGVVISTQASVDMRTLAKRAEQANNPLWFQLYIQEDPLYTDALIKKVEQSAYQALVITVDAPVNGMRYQEQRLRFAMPDFARPVNLDDLPKSSSFLAKTQTQAQAGRSNVFDSPMVKSALGWAELSRVIASTHLPVILKGITHPDEALKGLQCGAAGIIVSNHGGRVLDGMVASLDCLAAVAQTVKAFDGNRSVLFDGGIHSGSDCLKALALGADAVMIARPYLYGLAVGGASGVAHILHVLKTELEMAMVLCGCRTLEDINQDILMIKRA